MRPSSFLSWLMPICSLLALAGCPDSHGLDPDAGGDGGGCSGSSSLICVSSCGSDAGTWPVCVGGAWACPPGTVDLSTCPPSCVGSPPPGCTCEGTEWICEDFMCPEGLNPWDPTDPRSVCSVEGGTCTSGSTDACGVGMWCTCRTGRWECAVAEPDPVCWCGREPSEGDRCNEEGASCGECCPTAGGTGWDAMTCVDGHWTHAGCPDIECPPIEVECPVEPLSLEGQLCAVEGASCGHACCEGSVICEGGRWRLGPLADCARCPQYPCGTGVCNESQYCQRQCGPDDGIEHVCLPLPLDCTSCDCIPLWGTQSCEMIDGFPHVSDSGFCG